MPWKDAETRREHYRRNREKLLAEKKAYYERNRETIIAKVAARTDSEAKRAYDRKYNQRPDVRARRAEQRRAWNLAHPEHVIPHNKARSQARRGARADATAKSYMAVLVSDPCCYCGAVCEQIDHVVPIKRGGGSYWDNLTAACRSCNYAKRDKALLRFLLSASL